MSILKANLKHLYQCRGLWLWDLITLTQMGLVFAFLRMESQRYLGYLLICYFTGFMAGHVQKEILSKPFSFCLPGHSRIPQKFIFWVGLIVNALLGFVFLFYPGIEFPSVILVVLAGSIVGMAFYLFFAGLILSNLERKGFLSTIVIATVFAGFYLKWDLIIQEMILTSPLIVIASGLLLCWLVWRSSNVESTRRNCCGKMIPGFLEAWNREQMSKATRQNMLEKKEKDKPWPMSVSPGVETFFISKITQAETGSLQQYIWGTLYIKFGPGISRVRQTIKIFFMFILPLLCVYCYTPIGKVYVLLFFVAMFMPFMNMNTPVYSSLSVSGGRRQRLSSTLTQVVITTIFATVVLGALVITTHLLERVMPQLAIKGHEFVFNAIDIRILFVPLLVIPVAFTISLVMEQSWMLAILLFVVLLLIAFSIFGMIMNHKIQIAPVHLIIMLILSWVIFIAVLRYVSMRCCLVNQSK